jgi:hypothetical protein
MGLELKVFAMDYPHVVSTAVSTFPSTSGFFQLLLKQHILTKSPSVCFRPSEEKLT